MKAAQRRHIECVVILLAHGADPNLVDTRGNTALHYAVLNEDPMIAAKLLLHNASLEAQNEKGFTPLLLALREKKECMIEFVLSKGANVHAVDVMGRTALMLAIKSKSRHRVRFLVQQGVNVFSQDCCGWTALTYAIDSGRDMFKELVACNHEIKNKCYQRFPCEALIPVLTPVDALERPDCSGNNHLRVEEKLPMLQGNEERRENQYEGGAAAAGTSTREKSRGPESHSPAENEEADSGPALIVE